MKRALLVLSLILWNIAAFASMIQPIRRFKGHTSDSINSVAFSSDGLKLASAGVDHTVRLWDVQTGKEIQRFDLQLTFSPDGQSVAAACHDGSIELWDVKTGKESKVLKGHSDIVMSVAFSPDGHQIASGGWDRTLRLWDVGTGKEIQRYEQYMDVVNSVAFSPEGNYIVCNGVDGTVLVWDAVHPAPEMSFRRPSKRFGQLSDSTLFRSVAFSPDGRLIVAGGVRGSEGIAFVWDAQTGKEIRQIKPDLQDVACVAFSPNGHFIVSSGWWRKIEIWDLLTGRVMRTFIQTGDIVNNLVNSVQFSPDGTSIASASSGSPPELNLWSAESDEIHVAEVAIAEGQIPTTYENAVEEPQSSQQPQPEPTPRVGRKYGEPDPFGREPVNSPSGKFVLPRIDYDYAEVTILIDNFMKATQHGEPISLAPYCTKRLLQWYGKRQISIQQAETEIAAYFRDWLTQSKSFDVDRQMTFEPATAWPGLIAYRITLPYTWAASSGTESKTGSNVMVAIVVRTHRADGTPGEMRIMSVRNSNADN